MRRSGLKRSHAPSRTESIPKTVRIVAYNFLSGGSRKRSGHWARVMRMLAPDLILAQECRLPDHHPAERFRPSPADALLWQAVPDRPWGSAILARSSPACELRLGKFHGWVIGAEVTPAGWPNGRPMRVFSIHGPAGERGYVRTMHEILERIAAYASGADLILGGDFNIAVGLRGPGERITMTRGEREVLERLRTEFGLVSCWQAANPDRPLAQTLRWTADRSAPYHCDGIFVPMAWLDRLVACRVVRGSRWNTMSDHNPVVAEFNFTSAHPDKR